jgi:hypothetical protein
MTATASEIRELLGDIDPLVIERIVELDATLDEVVEALATLSDDDAVATVAGGSRSAKVDEIRELLAETIDEDHDEDYART